MERLGDWLGPGRIANQDRKHLSFDEAKKIVRSYRLNNVDEWKKFCKSGKRPPNIPANPVEAYLAQWKGYGDWLGTGRIANQDRKHLSFDEAKKIVKSMSRCKKLARSG